MSECSLDILLNSCVYNVYVICAMDHKLTFYVLDILTAIVCFCPSHNWMFNWIFGINTAIPR